MFILGTMYNAFPKLTINYLKKYPENISNRLTSSPTHARTDFLPVT